MFFVRTASARDIEPVRLLLSETLHAAYDDVHGAVKVQQMLDRLYSANALKARLAEKGGEFLVADDGKELGGMGFANMSTAEAKTSLLKDLYVRPANQRQGIGRDLFAELETCFPDAERMRVEVAADSAAANGFLEAHGFAEVGRIDGSANDEWTLPKRILEKPLSS